MEIRVDFPGNKKVQASFDGFAVSADQPVSRGGDGSAPSPFDLFLASIATCSGFYVLDFCAQRNIPTGQVGIVLRTEKNQETKMMEKISIEIQLPPDFPAKYKKAVVKAAELCSVKKHLMRPPRFDTFTTDSRR